MELAAAALICAMAVAAVALVYGVHLSNLIYGASLSARHAPPPLDITAESDGDGRVTLRSADPSASFGDWRRPGAYGIASARGYGRLGRVIEQGEAFVVREYAPLTAAVSAAEPARVDMFAYDDNPLTARGIPYEEIRYPTELGECWAWRIDGADDAESDIWTIFVHGRGAHPREALRILPTLAASGNSALCIAYRNDAGAPASADGRHWLGLTEWRDLEGAARYALDNGAAGVALFGCSMGGAICMNFLYESALADKVAGVILDAPLLDFAASLSHAANVLGYPSLITRYGKFVAGLRFGIDWQRMNCLARAGELSAPMLILHGEADTTLPAAASRALAEARPDIARYVGFAGAEHARAWNADSELYEAEVRRFLSSLQPAQEAAAARRVSRPAAT